MKSANNSKYLIGFPHDITKPLVLILLKMSGYMKIWKDKENKLMSFRIDNGRLSNGKLSVSSLSLVKVLIIAKLFPTLANLTQIIC